MPAPIPFNRPTHVAGADAAVAAVLAGDSWSADGPAADRCTAILEARLGSGPVTLTSSCSAALEMSALLLDLEPDDEVVVPAFTYPTTAAVFALRGARPVFADIDPSTLVVDLDHVEALVTPRTKALAVVHYGGVAPDMERVDALAAAHGLAVVEDLAHGPFARWRDRPLGSFGRLAVLSFHETKNFTCGEGGALVVNDDAFVEAAAVLHHKGTDRRRFERGEVPRYSWVAPASNYGLAEPLAAILAEQLAHADTVQATRAAIWHRYRDGLAGWARANDVQLPVVPSESQISHHSFHLVLPSPEQRDELISHLAEHEIHAVFHYTPLNLSPMGRALGAEPGACPVTESVAGRLVRLPFYTGLGDGEQARVLEAVCALTW
jgi:dTDP-4-amino-4,6-dideoxygalactose transaminase